MKDFELRGGLFRATAILLAGCLVSAVPLGAANNGKGNGNGNGGNSAAGSISYSAQAIVLKVDGVTQPQSGQIIICDTGSLPASGGALEVSRSNVNLYNGALRIDEASASATGVGPEAAAESSMTGYRVEFISHEGEHLLMEADYVYGRAAARTDRQGRVTFDTQVIVQNLRINGQAVAVTGAPNQRIDLPTGGWLIINEQANASSGASGDIAVSPLHFIVCDCIEGHVGLVRAGLTVSGTPPPPPPGECGKVTGGGWISGTPSGDKGTFGMSGGIRRGEFWGHLTYQDHGTGMKVQSTAVTGFDDDLSDINGRIITYNVTIDGQPGTARLRVVDNGEPGRDDIFDLTLSNGYHAAGDLGGAHPGGGNIQVHKCPPGWE